MRRPTMRRLFGELLSGLVQSEGGKAVESRHSRDLTLALFAAVTCVLPRLPSNRMHEASYAAPLRENGFCVGQ